jgi:hypothetical protein
MTSSGGQVEANSEAAIGILLLAASRRSITATTAKTLEPILMVGISPRRAAAYELLRLKPKYFFPASGTGMVGLPSGAVGVLFRFM